MAEHVGEVGCPECGESCAVKADKRKFIYLDCACGIFKYQSKSGQEKIKARWRKEQPEKAGEFLGGAEVVPEKIAVEEPETEAVKPEVKAPVIPKKPALEKAPKKASYFERSRQRRELRRVAKGAV